MTKNERKIYNAKWHRDHPSYSRDWGRDNPEKVSQKNCRYYKSHKDRLDSENRKRLKNNPALKVAANHRRRARELRAEGTFTASQWNDLCALYGYMCLCCNKHKPLEADHVVPISKGGTNFISNIQPLCRRCNAKKSTDSIDYR